MIGAVGFLTTHSHTQFATISPHSFKMFRSLTTHSHTQVVTSEIQDTINNYNKTYNSLTYASYNYSPNRVGHRYTLTTHLHTQVATSCFLALACRKSTYNSHSYASCDGGKQYYMTRLVNLTARTHTQVTTWEHLTKTLTPYNSHLHASCNSVKILLKRVLKLTTHTYTQIVTAILHKYLVINLLYVS